jgi:hypothetical protein
MNAIQVLQSTLGSTQWMLNKFIEDLADPDVLIRPVPGANHIAWQLGHLINSEAHLVKEQIPEAVYPELPAGWAEAHGPKATGKDGPDGFWTKSDYQRLFNEVRQATIATVGKLSEEDLDRPTTGRMASMFPKLGNYLLLIAEHTLMHAGQFSVVRRKVGKPVLF